jgi:epoxyqueuosine reductase
LTIEHRSDDIDRELQSQMGTWVFGCDICQDVCPWNKFARQTSERRFMPEEGITNTPVSAWLEIDRDRFNQRFRHSAVKRTKFEGLKRNLRIAQSNLADGAPD